MEKETFQKKRAVQERTAKESAGSRPAPDRGLKRWRLLAVCWPLTCVVLAGIIISQTDRGGEERIVDAVFTIFPLIFFSIGMTMEHRLLKEKRNATVSTSALVVLVRSSVRIGSGNRRCYFPEYEFQVGEATYHVKSPSGFDRSYVRKGEWVELYYAPDNPDIFYVPVMRKHDKRWAALLCGVG